MSNFDKIAAVIRKNDRTTPDAPFSKEDLINVLMRIIGETPVREKPQVMLPVELPKDTKKNKARLIAEDRLSPMGVILKGDGGHSFDSAVAVFNALEVMTWLFHHEDAEPTPAAA